MQVPRDSIADSATIYPGVYIGEHVTIHPGAVVGRFPLVAGVVHNQPYVKGQTRIGDGSVIGANAVIYAGTLIGQGVLIGDGATIRENCTIGDQSIVGNNCTFQNDVVMGKRSRVIDLSHITAQVIIEDDVFISTGVLTMNDNSMAHGGPLQPPVIRGGAMVGGGAILLPGVEIGEGATVAAGSVVTKRVEPNTRVQGVPAKPYIKTPQTEYGVSPTSLRPERRMSDDEIWAHYYFEYDQDR